MADLKNFKCPCCGTMLKFSGKDGEMACEACGAHFTMEQMKAAEEAEQEAAQGTQLEWQTSGQEEVSEAGFKGYSCPSCGAELVADEKTAATECPYCGNPAIIAKSFEGMYRPDLVVPFAVDKDQARAALKDFVKGKKLLPSAFTDRNRIEEITGLYVPFWLYSCHAEGLVSFEGCKSKKWEDAAFRYEKKDYYHIIRRGGMDFEHIPVDASTRMDDDTMDSLEPYDLSKAVAYQPAYFSGYLADRYDVKEKDAQPRANERVTNTFRQKMRDAVKDYSEVKQKAESIRLSDAKAEYAMLPVWMMSTSYGGKVYPLAVNGQSGKMIGSLPIDQGKYYKYFAIAAAICFAIISAIVFFLGSRGFSAKGEIAAAVIALIVGFIYAGHLKGTMNTITKKRSAASYLKENSLKMGTPRDRFIYTKTEKAEKSKAKEPAKEPPKAKQTTKK